MREVRQCRQRFGLNGKKNGVKALLQTMTHEESPVSEDSSYMSPNLDSKISESIFSQLLQRLLGGRGVKLGDETEVSGSLAILLENSRDAILLLTPAGIVVDANPPFCQAYGLTRSELAGSNLVDLMPKDHWPSFSEKLVLFGARDQDAPAESYERLHGIQGEGKGRIRAIGGMPANAHLGGRRAPRIGGLARYTGG